MRWFRRVLVVGWALPWTMVGLAVGFFGVLTGGGMSRRGRVLEFWGGWPAQALARLPFVTGGARAITLGHTILGRSKSDLDGCRTHEFVHVRQYERWGLLFVPAYLSASLALWLIHRDPYRDNPFERQAFADSDPGGPRPEPSLGA
jgi:hypothetical protein